MGVCCAAAIVDRRVGLRLSKNWRGGERESVVVFVFFFCHVHPSRLYPSPYFVRTQDQGACPRCVAATRGNRAGQARGQGKGRGGALR